MTMERNRKRAMGEKVELCGIRWQRFLAHGTNYFVQTRKSVVPLLLCSRIGELTPPEE